MMAANNKPQICLLNCKVVILAIAYVANLVSLLTECILIEPDNILLLDVSALANSS